LLSRQSRWEALPSRPTHWHAVAVMAVAGMVASMTVVLAAVAAVAVVDLVASMAAVLVAMAVVDMVASTAAVAKTMAAPPTP